VALFAGCACAWAATEGKARIRAKKSLPKERSKAFGGVPVRAAEAEGEGGAVAGVAGESGGEDEVEEGP